MSEQALRAPPGVPALPWRGAVPGAQMNSNQAGVQVAYGLSIGVTNNTVIDLQVCWYTPTAANNTYTNGNAFGCTIVGSQTANSWTSQQCPAGEVVSGYRVGLKANRDRIKKLATICRSLSNPSSTRTFGFVGDPNVLFVDTLDCTSHMGQTAYIEYFSSNNNFTGFNGVCDNKYNPPHTRAPSSTPEGGRPRRGMHQRHRWYSLCSHSCALVCATQNAFAPRRRRDT